MVRPASQEAGIAFSREYRSIFLSLGMLHVLTVILQIRGGGSRYSTPHDSTQGVPAYVFIGCWILIILFVLRIAWEFRNDIFKRKS